MTETKSIPTTRAAYPLDEACQLLGGCSRGHLYNLARRGELRLVRIGRRVLVPRSEIQRLTEGIAPSHASTERIGN